MSSKVALITGASAGIGRASAIALSAKGWNVVLTGRNLKNLEETQRSCVPGTTLVVAGEVTDEAFVIDLFKQTIDLFGRLDLLFNNAGITMGPTPIEETSLEAFQNVLNVNVVGPFLCTREAFKIFKKQTPQGGRIINNGSLSAHTPRPHAFAYGTSKHAVNGLTKCTALDGRNHNITCTQIDIGNAHTAMGGQMTSALQPDGRIMSEDTFAVDHVAEAIVHIASMPNTVTLLEYSIMAGKAPFVGRG